MAEYTLGSICTDIHTTLEGVTGISKVYNYYEIPDSIPNMDLPLFMVYPNLLSPYSASSETQTFSFLGNTENRITIRDWVFIADLFVKQRAIFRESLALLATHVQSTLDILDTQPGQSPFGTPAIKSFQYEGERVVINYGDADYDAMRFTITVRIF